MKFSLLLLLPIFLNAQDSIQSRNMSVISAEKLNVVYRGVPNPLKIAVPGAKSFVATAPGLVKTDSIGNYKFSAGSGNTVTIRIDAIMNDNKVKHEEKVFRIMGLPMITALLNDRKSNYSPIHLSKKDLSSTKVSVTLEDFLFLDSDSDFYRVHSFNLTIGTKNIYVEGNQMTKEAIKAISKLKKGSWLTLTNIKYGNYSPEALPRKVNDLVIEITD